MDNPLHLPLNKLVNSDKNIYDLLIFDYFYVIIQLFETIRLMTTDFRSSKKWNIVKFVFFSNINFFLE